MFYIHGKIFLKVRFPHIYSDADQFVISPLKPKVDYQECNVWFQEIRFEMMMKKENCETFWTLEICSNFYCWMRFIWLQKYEFPMGQSAMHFQKHTCASIVACFLFRKGFSSKVCSMLLQPQLFCFIFKL